MREGVGIKQVQEGRLVLEDGTEQSFDECLWCTQASAPSWLTTTGLQTGATPFPSPAYTSSQHVPAHPSIYPIPPISPPREPRRQKKELAHVLTCSLANGLAES